MPAIDQADLFNEKTKGDSIENEIRIDHVFIINGLTAVKVRNSSVHV